ncbi:MAG: 2-oxoacid:acceptor oxidoreductase family protein, partial [Candidatus Rokubacteria bacterium]|nr:2-oxoacid:acceptor oxidoreductase family protein [Candidatus Rokubacteria bacterium]
MRLPLDQHRADRRREINTATIISGYPGSPLGGFDLNLQRSAALLAEHNVRFIPGLNEELGGTIVFGGQLAAAFPEPKYDVNQILGTAALLDGRFVRGLDQTGLSQKGVPVVSRLKISSAPRDISNKVGAGTADCYLGFDLLVATAAANLDRARPDRTVAVISTSHVPTGAMVSSPELHFPEAGGLIGAINRVTRKDETIFLDALGLAEALVGDHMMANL